MNESNNIVKLSNCKITNIPNTYINIDNKIYKVSNAIFHHGNSIDEGHYTNMLRKNNTWIRVDDLNEKKKTNLAQIQ